MDDHTFGCYHKGPFHCSAIYWSGNPQNTLNLSVLLILKIASQWIFFSWCDLGGDHCQREVSPWHVCMQVP